HLFGAGLTHHVAGGVGRGRLDLGAALERPVRTFAVVADALGVHPRALAAPGHGVGHLLADLFPHRPADGVGDLLDALLADRPGDLARHLLGDRVRNLPANGVGHLRANPFADIGRAGDGLADGPFVPDLAGAHLVGRAAGHADAPLVANFLAGARVEAALADALPRGVAAAWLAVLLLAPLTAAPGDGLASRHRLADVLHALLAASLGHVAVAGAANV